MWPVCSERYFRRAQQTSIMLLTSFRFRRCGAGGGADPGDFEVNGSDPPVFGPGSGAGPSLLCTAPPRPSGTPHHLSNGGSPARRVAPVSSILAGRRAYR